jgi:hypothetical protein
VRLNGGFDAIYPELALHQAHGFEQGWLVHDGSYLDVIVQPAFQLVIEILDGTFAYPDYPCAGGVQRAHEFPLVAGERWLDKDNVHGRDSRRKAFT